MKNGWIGSLSAACFLLLCGCGRDSSPPPAAAEPPALPVKAVTAELRKYHPEFTGIASVKALRKVEIRARVAGFITSRLFHEGDRVPADTLLYVIEQDQYQLAIRSRAADLAEAEADRTDAELEFQRAKTLLDEAVAAPKKFDTARMKLQSSQARVEAARAALAEAHLNLQYTEIRAPFAGRMGLSKLDAGNYVAAPSPVLAALVDDSSVRVEFHLTDQAISRQLRNDLSAGKFPDWPVHLYCSDGTRYPRTGRIAFWDNALNASTGTLAVQAEFENPDGILWDGMYVQLKLADPVAREVVSVPQRAVQYLQTRAFVYVIDADGRLEQRFIEPGETFDGYIVVAHGLTSGERVAMPGNPMLRAGVKVAVLAPPVQHEAQRL